MPLVNDIAAMKGSLGYWINNQSTYHGIGLGFPISGFANSIADIACFTPHFTSS